MASDIASASRKGTSKNLPILRDYVLNIQQYLPTLPLTQANAVKSLKKKLHDHGLLIAQADKGEASVILSETAYVEKVHAFLSQSGAIQKTFSIDYRNRKVRKAIREAKLIIPDEKTREKLYVMHVAIPALYGQIKTHKQTSDSFLH